ncbi:MAG: ATP-binding protein [Planctomycetota bacterium]
MTWSQDGQPSASADSQLFILNEFAVSLLKQQTLEDLLWEMASNIGRLLGFEDCVIYLVQSGELVQAAAYGPKSPARREIVSPLRFPISRGITGAAASTGEVQLVRDVRGDPRYVPDSVSGLSELAVPVLFEGQCQAVIDSEAAEPGYFTDNHIQILQSLAAIAAPRISGAITEQRRLEADLRLQAANQELEARVAARTAELRQALASLRREGLERERLQEEQAKAQRLESLGVLAGGLAHDFNNLLQGMAAHISLARSDLEAGPSEVLESLDEAEAACFRARDLTQQLQAFARGGAPVKRETDLVEVVRSTADFTLRGLGVQSSLDAEPGIEPLLIDSSQIAQVIQNLVLNAAESMNGAEGVVGIRIRSCHYETQPAIEVQVEDSGQGVSAESMHRIFEPYFTTKERGSGLGLASAFGIVQRHGGDLALVETSSTGSTFRMVLPRTGASEAAPAPSRPRRSGPGRVLLMDDHDMVRRATKGLLVEMGYQVIDCADGDSAVSAFRRARDAGQTIDLAILDLTVPGGLGGLEALRRLRALDPDLRSIVVSGYSDTPVLAHPKSHGFDAALRKPFGLAELREVVQPLIEG